MNVKGVFSHESDNWRTPSELFNLFMRGGFVDCFKFMDKENELEKNYFNQKLFINPPYSKLGEVSKWVIQQAQQKNLIWLLLPVRTDTKYFKEIIDQCGDKLQLIFITGRLKFNDSKNSAPFPSFFIVISDKITQGQSFTVMTYKELLADLDNYL